MKNKKILVLGITLILLVMVVGVVMAAGGDYRGVMYEWDGGNTIFWNRNDYTVQVGATNEDGEYTRFRLNANATKTLAGRYTVTAAYAY